MSLKLNLPKLSDLKPRLTVIGIGGAGCNAINNMIASGLEGVDFVVANTDAQALAASSAEHSLQLGVNLTEGLGAGARPEIGQAAAEEAIEDIRAQISGAHMVFLAAGMGGGTGTGAAAVIARVAREMGILTVGVVTKPFHFEGRRRMRVAEAGIEELKEVVDTLIVIPNQNLFLVANEKTSFGEAFLLADQVLYSGVACIVDLILKEGLINLDFADVRTVMANMGTAMMGTGEADGENRATLAAEEAISNPLLDDVSLKGAKGLLLSITGGKDLRLFDVEAAASRVREEVDPEANIIVGATFDEALGDRIRVSIVASGMAREERLDEPGRPSRMPPPSRRTADNRQSRAADGELPGFNADQGAMAPPPLPMAQAQEASPTLPALTPQEPNLDATYPDQGVEDLGLVGEGDGLPMAASTEPWVAPGDVLIEEAAPRFSAEEESTPAPAMPPVANNDGTLPQEDDFSLQPPPAVGAQRMQARIPEIGDFPAVGQRVYRAHHQMDDEFGHGENNEGDKKSGLIDRLRLLGRPRQSDSNQDMSSDSIEPMLGSNNGNDRHNSREAHGPGNYNANDLDHSSQPIEETGSFRRRRS